LVVNLVLVSGNPVVMSDTPVVVGDTPVVVGDTPVVVSGTPESLPVDCSDLYNNGFGNSGVYTIFPAGPTSPVQVFCEMGSMDAPDSNKWTVMYELASFSMDPDLVRTNSLDLVHHFLFFLILDVHLVENIVKRKRKWMYFQSCNSNTVKKNTTAVMIFVPWGFDHLFQAL
jgi:hypothetical protein